MKILIIGAGGHGQVVADIFLAQQFTGASNFQLLGFLDDDPTLHHRSILGLPVLGPVSSVTAIPHNAAVMGIGHNPTRAKIFEQLRTHGETFVNAVHPSAIIGSSVKINCGVVICAGVIINTGTVIEPNVILNTGCTVDHHNRLETHAHIAPGVHLGGDVSIGQGCLVGIGSTILPQRSIGVWSTVGAGAVVTRDVPAHTTVVGIPARVVGVRAVAAGD